MFDFLIDIVPREDLRWPSQSNNHVGCAFVVHCCLSVLLSIYI